MIKFDFRKFFPLSLEMHPDKLLFFIALAILLGALFAFFNQPNISSESPRALVFTQWYNEELPENVLISLIEEFESNHNGIKITLDNRAHEDIWRDFFYSTKEVQLGDIVVIDQLWVPELLKKEIIESPSTALYSSINVLYYNIDILREAGFSRPPRNRSEFINYSRAISREKRQGLVMSLNSSRGVYDDVFPWIWSAGAQIINNGNPTLATNPVINSLSFLASLNDEGLILLNDNSNGGKLDDFVQGRVAFMVAPAGKIKLVSEQMGDDAFSVTSIPVPDNYAGRTFFASQEWVLAINSTSDYKQEAQLFMDFFIENTPLFAGQTRDAQSGHNIKAWEIAMAGENAGDIIGRAWFELNSIFREELEKLFLGSSIPAETAAAIQRRWGTVLNE